LPTLSKADALGTLINKFLDPDIDLSPAGIDNHAMGTVFEELVRKFNEDNNEEAGEHWTPRDAVRLMANLVFLPVEDQLKSGTYLLYDDACGTGGMLTVAEETLTAIGNRRGLHQVRLYGQEINPETYAICKADMLLKGEGENADHIVGGAEWSTLAHDAFPGQEFDFMLANPPYGKSWKKDLEAMGGKDGMRDPRFKVMHEGEELSLVTRSSDGQMLFLANMASKMNHSSALGSRIAEVHNGSSLFTGDAGQGESNIRRWLIENDWLEAIVALPLNLFYNTGIATYVWVLSNRKPAHRQGRVQLIDASQWFKPLRKNLGKKNCELGPDDIERIGRTFLDFKETPESKIFPNAAFGYWKVTVERPLRLHSQLSLKAIETLRFASGDEDLRAVLYEEFGDDLFNHFGGIATTLDQRLADWGSDDEDADDDESGAPKKGLPEKKRKKLLDPKTWERDGRLVEVATSLRASLGDGLFEDHNVFRDRVDAALKKAGTKLPAAELKLILKAVSWRVETAPPVIAKVHKPGKLTADPMLGLYDAVVAGKPASSSTNPTPTCATPSRCRCWKRAASRPSSAARCCPTRPTPGSTTTPPRSATRSASRATSTSRSRCARWPRSAPTSWPSRKRPKACWMVCYRPPPVAGQPAGRARRLRQADSCDGVARIDLRVRHGLQLHRTDPDGALRRVDDRRADSCDAVANFELEPLRRTAAHQGPVGPRLLCRDVPHRALGRPHPAPEDRRHAVPAHRAVEAAEGRDLG
jgi:type I restriction enzyme M protein